MKILVVVDASASFIDDDQWEHLKKVVNETVTALEHTNEVQLAKVSTSLRFCTVDDFNNGWTEEDGGSLDINLLKNLQYSTVLFITDGFVDLKSIDNSVSVMIIEDPSYVKNPNPIVGFLCEHCNKEKGLHQANKNFCPEKKGYFSKINKFVPNVLKPVRRFIL